MSRTGAVRDSLREHPLPGEAEAAARSWPVVEAAFAERAGAARGRPSATLRRPVARAALVGALVAAALAAALSPAGAAVGDWIGDRLGRGAERAEPAFAALPRGGSVLAISRSGAYAIRPDGSVRRLGAFTAAGWSPHGLHVAGVEGRRLVAVDAAGTVKWTLTGRHPLSHPSWSTGLGYAVAYIEGHTLRVVAGNGDPTTNRVRRRDAAPVTPAWAPGSDRFLTYVTTGGVIQMIDLETGRPLWRAPVAASALAWTRQGRSLVALRSHSVTILDRSGRIRRTISLPGVARDLAVSPSGTRVAVVVGNRVVQVDLHGTVRRQLFQGNVDGIAWSQDGRRLLLGWRDADEWLLLGPGGRIRALHGVSGELGVAGGFPRVAAWCCSG
jgi:hypothetical protein